MLDNSHLTSTVFFFVRSTEELSRTWYLARTQNFFRIPLCFVRSIFLIPVAADLCVHMWTHDASDAVGFILKKYFYLRQILEVITKFDLSVDEAHGRVIGLTSYFFEAPLTLIFPDSISATTWRLKPVS